MQQEGNANEFTFHAPLQHPLFAYNHGYDVSMRTRECYYGGHILKVLSIERCLEAYRAFAKSELGSAGLNRNSEFEQSMKRKINEKGGHAKLNYDQTAMLLGISRIYQNNLSSTTTLPWYVLPVDEF